MNENEILYKKLRPLYRPSFINWHKFSDYIYLLLFPVFFTIGIVRLFIFIFISLCLFFMSEKNKSKFCNSNLKRLYLFVCFSIWCKIKNYDKKQLRNKKILYIANHVNFFDAYLIEILNLDISLSISSNPTKIFNIIKKISPTTVNRPYVNTNEPRDLDFLKKELQKYDTSLFIFPEAEIKFAQENSYFKFNHNLFKFFQIVQPIHIKYIKILPFKIKRRDKFVKNFPIFMFFMMMNPITFAEVNFLTIQNNYGTMCAEEFAESVRQALIKYSKGNDLEVFFDLKYLTMFN